jgi:cytochrome c oxidase subunit 2
MKQLLIAIVVTAVLGAGLTMFFSGDHGGRGQADFALAATPEAPSAAATAFPTSTAAAAAAPGASTASPGQALATKLGCAACHSVGGAAGVGPTWKGLFGESVPLADGSTVTADEAYIKESITSPNAKIVKGFSANIMPQTFSSLTPEQLNDLVSYIKTLK